LFFFFCFGWLFFYVEGCFLFGFGFYFCFYVFFFGFVFIFLVMFCLFFWLWCFVFFFFCVCFSFCEAVGGDFWVFWCVLFFFCKGILVFSLLFDAWFSLVLWVFLGFVGVLLQVCLSCGFFFGVYGCLLVWVFWCAVLFFLRFWRAM